MAQACAVKIRLSSTNLTVSRTPQPSAAWLIVVFLTLIPEFQFFYIFFNGELLLFILSTKKDGLLLVGPVPVLLYVLTLLILSEV